MDERDKLALASAGDVIKQVLTLSTAILAFTVTFSTTIAKNAAESDLYWLRAAWLLLGGAIFFGVWALLALTGMIGKKANALDIYQGNVRVPSAVQMVTFGLALVFTAVFGWFALSGPHPSAPSKGTCSIEAPARGTCTVP